MEFLNEHKYAVAGALLALVLMTIIFSLGIFKTIILFLVIAAGAYVGNLLKGTGILEDLIAKYRNK